MAETAETPESFNDEFRGWVKNNADPSITAAFARTEGLSRQRFYDATDRALTTPIPAKLLVLVIDAIPRPDDPQAEVFRTKWREHWNNRLFALEEGAFNREQRPTEPAAPAGEMLADVHAYAHSPALAPAPPGAHFFQDACERLGLMNAFVPLHDESGVAVNSTNARRNARKLEVLAEAAERGSTVRLLAETGNSYLHLRGPFNTALIALLAGNGRLEVVLMNPDEHLLGDQEELRIKFKQSLRGFVELERTYPGQVDLQILRARLTSTVLLTEQTSFFEPYLHTSDNARERLLLSTFEFEFGRESRFHQTLLSNFELHQRQAEPPGRWVNGV